MENKLKHLEMIQGVINRMANNSFLIKGWSVVLVAALFALAAKDNSVDFIYLAYFPAIAFWSLDGFYLRQERLYRKMYDKVRTQKEEEIDFSISTSEFNKDVSCWFCTCISPTLRIFHGAIFGTILVVMIVALK
jgi:hypothetical protein